MLRLKVEYSFVLKWLALKERVVYILMPSITNHMDNRQPLLSASVLSCSYTKQNNQIIYISTSIVILYKYCQCSTS